MDIASVIGLVAAFILIVMAMGDPSVFIDVPSVLIVIGGTAATVLNTTTIPGLIGAIKVFLKSILNSPEPPEKTIEQLVELGTIAKKDGFVALEGQEIKNPFMARGVRMLVDGTDPALIKQSMQTEMDQIKARHQSGNDLLGNAQDLAPAMGMIGTLVGLVIMLGNMSDPKALGPAMAIAILTTLYGAIIANVIFMPARKKLEAVDAAESINNLMITDAVLFIQAGGNPRLIPDLLIGFIIPGNRAKVQAAVGG
jgi:chemotaxis protein MotA